MDLGKVMKEFIKVVSVTYLKTSNTIVVRDEEDPEPQSSSSSSSSSSSENEINNSQISFEI